MEVYLLGENDESLELPWIIFNAIIMLLVSLGEDVGTINDSDYMDSELCESYGAAILGAVQTGILKRIVIKDGNYHDGYAEYYIGPKLAPPDVFDIHYAIAEKLSHVDIGKISNSLKISKLEAPHIVNLNRIGHFFISSGGIAKTS